MDEEEIFPFENEDDIRKAIDKYVRLKCEECGEIIKVGEELNHIAEKHPYYGGHRFNMFVIKEKVEE